MRFILLLATLVAVASAYYKPDSKCMKCICQHESGCRPLSCRQDVGSLSCGYYQMKSAYYTVSGRLRADRRCRLCVRQECAL